MSESKLTQHQREVLEKVLALQEHTKRTGFITRRSQDALLKALDPEDLAAVVMELNKR